MKHAVLASLLAGWLAPVAASDADPCAELDHALLRIVANGHVGTVGAAPGGLALEKGNDGRYQFRAVGNWRGEQPSRMSGTCSKGAITLIREGPGNLRQEFRGRLFQRLTMGSDLTPLPGHAPTGEAREFREMSGMFRQVGEAGQYGWHAWIDWLKPFGAIRADSAPVSQGDAQPPVPKCAISGRIEGPPAWVKGTSIIIKRQSATAAEERLARPDDQGRYVFEGIERGNYRLTPDTKGDAGFRFEPAFLDVRCVDPVVGANFRIK